MDGVLPGCSEGDSHENRATEGGPACASCLRTALLHNQLCCHVQKCSVVSDFFSYNIHFIDFSIIQKEHTNLKCKGSDIRPMRTRTSKTAHGEVGACPADASQQGPG